LAAGLPEVTAVHIARKGAERLADKYRLFGAKDGQIAGLIEAHVEFQHANAHLIKPYAGALRTMQEIRKKGLKNGIVTGRDEKSGELVLKITGLAPLVDARVFGDKTTRIKPNPGQFLECAQLLQTEPGHCLVVGDSKADIEGGNAAGMKTALAAYGYGAIVKSEIKPDYTLNAIGDVLEII